MVATSKKPVFEKLCWADVREDVAKVKPELVEIIDQINPGKECSLYRARYPYGFEIIKDGRLLLPTENGKGIALDDAKLDKEIYHALKYNLQSNPVALVLKNTLELFCTQGDRVVPLLGLVPPGGLFGMYRVLNTGGLSNQPTFNWQMSSGVRSIFMLPKVSEQEKYKRLKRTFLLKTDKPRNLADHWQVFRELANHAETKDSWETEMLFFSMDWFKHFDDTAWMPFNYFFYRHAWERSDYWRNNVMWNLIYSMIQRTQNVRSNMFVTDTVAHLLGVAAGEAAGFAPALDDTAAPISLLQKIYHDVYGLRNYLPTILHLHRYDLMNPNARPVYYSLQFPTSMEFGPKSSKHTSLIIDLYDVRTVLNKYLDELKTGKFHVDETRIDYAVQHVKFDYFHPNADLYEGLSDSKLIARHDKTFRTSMIDSDAKEFPSSSAFLKGCIRIGPNETSS